MGNTRCIVCWWKGDVWVWNSRLDQFLQYRTWRKNSSNKFCRAPWYGPSLISSHSEGFFVPHIFRCILVPCSSIARPKAVRKRLSLPSSAALRSKRLLLGGTVCRVIGSSWAIVLVPITSHLRNVLCAKLCQKLWMQLQTSSSWWLLESSDS